MVGDFNGVVRFLSDSKESYQKALQLFTMQSWRPGNWMKIPSGQIVCVNKEVADGRQREAARP
jgi:hypothetical protein